MKLEFTGLDLNMRVILSNELGKSGKKIVGLGERCELFKLALLGDCAGDSVV